MEEQIIDAAFNNITPVIESSVILAGEYCKKCGRTTMTDMDMKYAMRFAARNVVGRIQGPMFPELLEDVDSDEESSDIEEVDEVEEPFTRYQGDDPQMNSINECYDTWDSWVPASPLEKMLKSAIDSRER